MPPSLKALQPTRHSMPYPTSLPMTLSPNSLSFFRFTQPFTPFSPEPPGVWQVLLTSSGLPLLRNLPPFLPLSSVFLRHKNLSLTFYTLSSSTLPSSSSHPPSLMLFSPQSFFCSWKVNNWLSMQITPFPLVSHEPSELPPPFTPFLAPSLSISAEVCLLIETIHALEALLKERTPIPPSFLQSHLLQMSPPPPPLYHQVTSFSQISSCSLLYLIAKECHYIYCWVGLFSYHQQYSLYTRSNSKMAPSNFHQSYRTHSNPHSNLIIHKHEWLSSFLTSHTPFHHCYDCPFFSSPFPCIPMVLTRVSTSRVFDPHRSHLFPFRFFPTSSELTALFSQNVLFRTFLCIT